MRVRLAAAMPAAVIFDCDASARAHADHARIFRVADVIDRTGSTDPAAIEKALQATSSPTN